MTHKSTQTSSTGNVSPNGALSRRGSNLGIMSRGRRGSGLGMGQLGMDMASLAGTGLSPMSALYAQDVYPSPMIGKGRGVHTMDAMDASNEERDMLQRLVSQDARIVVGSEDEEDEEEGGEGGEGEGEGPASGEGGRRYRKKGKKKKKDKDVRQDLTAGALCKTIPQIYEEKILSDASDIAQGRMPDKSLPDFIKDFFGRRYGLPSLAKSQLDDFMKSVVRLQAESPRIQLFAVIVGLVPHSEGVVHTDMMPDFVLRALGLLLPHSKISELLGGKGTGLVEVEVAFSAASKVLQVGSTLQPKRNIRELIVETARPGKNTLPAVSVDTVLSILLEELLIVTGRLPLPSDAKLFSRAPSADEGGVSISRSPSNETRAGGSVRRTGPGGGGYVSRPTGSQFARPSAPSTGEGGRGSRGSPVRGPQASSRVVSRVPSADR